MAIAYQSGVLNNSLVTTCPPEVYGATPYIKAREPAQTIDNVNVGILGANLDFRYLPGAHGRLSSSGVYASGVNNQDAILYFPAPGPGRNHVVNGIVFGYRSSPSGVGFVGIQSPSGTTIFRAPVASAGVGPLYFGNNGKRGADNADMLVMLSGGGSGVIADINICEKWID